MSGVEGGESTSPRKEPEAFAAADSGARSTQTASPTNPFLTLGKTPPSTAAQATQGARASAPRAVPAPGQSSPAAALPPTAPAASALSEEHVYGTLDDAVDMSIPAPALAAAFPTPLPVPSPEPRKTPPKPCAGWLKKLGAKGLIKSWKLRWCVLDRQQMAIFYYKNPRSRVSLGHIPLPGALMWLNKLEQASATAHGYFTISTRKREYQLTSENEITMQQWLDVLQPTRDAADVALAADLTADAVGAVGVYRHPDQCVIIGAYDPATGDDPASSSDEDVPWDTGVGHGKPMMPTLESQHEGDETSPTRATHSRGASLRGFLRRKTSLGGLPRPKNSASGSPSHSASPQGGGGGGDGQPGSSALQQALISMQAELRQTKAKLRATEQALSQETERTTDLSDTVDHLRHVIEAGGLGVAIPVDGNEQKSYQIDCLRQQNQFMNVELLKMKAVIKTQNADGDELREAYDRANNIQVMLLGAVADAQNVETIKVRATELLQGTLSNAESLSARVKRGSVHPGDSGMPGTNASYYDQWGFRVSHNLSAAYHTLKDQTSAVEKRTIHRWEAYLAHRPAAEVLPAKECPELKQLVRDGIPDRLRSQMWAEFVYMHTHAERRFKGQDYYVKILEHKSGKTSVATKQIELDLMRTFPTHRDYHVVGSPKIASLRRILVAFSWHNPTIGYCQGLNMLGALALLFVDEETAFWALVAIVETIMPKRYFTRHMEASQADQRVLRELLHARCPKISAHLDKHEVDLSLITFNWMLVLFVECVPPATAIRIWDALLYEGSKIIFRVSLAVFITHQAEILRTHDRQELFDLIRGIPMRLYDSTALFKAAFHSLGGISGFSLLSKDIREKRAVKFEEVQQEMKELEDRQRRYSMARVQAAAAREAEQAAVRAPSPAEASGQVAGSVAPHSHPQPDSPGRVPAPSPKDATTAAAVAGTPVK